MIDLLRRARRIFDNPSRGIEYNKIIPNRKMSHMIYDVDIARNPQIVRDSVDGLLFVDVQAKVNLINSERVLLDKDSSRVRGRSR